VLEDTYGKVNRTLMLKYDESKGFLFTTRILGQDDVIKRSRLKEKERISDLESVGGKLK
jgi:hypothetical protein